MKTALFLGRFQPILLQKDRTQKSLRSAQKALPKAKQEEK